MEVTVSSLYCHHKLVLTAAKLVYHDLYQTFRRLFPYISPPFECGLYLSLTLALVTSILACYLSWLFNYLFFHCLTPLGDSCAHWMHHSDATKAREGWARNLLDEFRSNVEMLKSAVRHPQGSAPAHGSPQHGKQTTWTSCLLYVLCYD